MHTLCSVNDETQFLCVVSLDDLFDGYDSVLLTIKERPMMCHAKCDLIEVDESKNKSKFMKQLVQEVHYCAEHERHLTVGRRLISA